MNTPARTISRVLGLLLATLLLTVVPARADIIPEGQKPIIVSAVLQNLADFPDYVFVRFETLGGEPRAAEPVLPGHGVIRSYKLNQLEILAVPKALIERAGGLDKVDLAGDPAVLRSGGAPIESGQQLVPRSSPAGGMEVYYRVSLADGAVRLEKTGHRIFAEHPNTWPVNLFLWAFIVTFAVELLVFVSLVRLGFRRRDPGAVRAVLSVLAAQAATLPLLWLIIERYDLMGAPVMLMAESFAVAVESVVYRFLARLTWRQAFIAALLCNAASYAVGLLA